jgi:hypothetical protein
MSTTSIAALADRIAPGHVQHPMIAADVADELLARLARAHAAVEEAYELVARLAGAEAVE